LALHARAGWSSLERAKLNIAILRAADGAHRDLHIPGEAGAVSRCASGRTQRFLLCHLGGRLDGRVQLSIVNVTNYVMAPSIIWISDSTLPSR